MVQNILRLLFLALVQQQCLSLTCPIVGDGCNCDLNSRIIRCDKNERLNLKYIFEYLNRALPKTHYRFDSFELNSNTVTYLEPDVFGELTFRHIEINCPYLKRIHTNAFTATNLMTEELTISSSSLNTTRDNATELFEILSKFVKAKIIKLDIRSMAIPNQAFQSINGLQNDLSVIALSNVSYIGKYAFYMLPNLARLSLSGTFDRIDKASLALREASTNRFVLDLSSTLIENSAFDLNSLTRFRRPTTIYLGCNPNDYISEEIFGPFLDINKNNTIDLTCRKVRDTCLNCNHRWLIIDRYNYKNQVVNFRCGSNYDSFWDLSPLDIPECTSLELAGSFGNITAWYLS